MTMPNNKISPDLFSAASDVRWRSAALRPSLVARVTARLKAYQFDRQLAVGVPAPAGSALAVHEARLTSMAQRESIASALRQALHHVRAGGTPLSARIPVHFNNIEAAEDLLDTITLLLDYPPAVSR